MFEKLIWQQDRVLLNDLVFRMEHYKSEDWNLGENCFVFYKTKELIDQYEEFWTSRKNFRPRSMLELGLWDGGSVAFWFEYFHPEKHVGIDIRQREDSSFFKRYMTSKGLEKRIKTYWGTNQNDSERLREIVKDEFANPLDLVIDDASHMYEFTKNSFETLFPLLCPGGLYIIEDWAWAHWKEFQAPEHPWALETELTKLIFELVEVTGSSTAGSMKLIKNLSIFQGFVVVERGEISSAELGEFKLDEYISRRSKLPAYSK